MDIGIHQCEIYRNCTDLIEYIDPSIEQYILLFIAAVLVGLSIIGVFYIIKKRKESSIT